MGIIDSISAGYRFLGRRVELILIPVLLDLLIWLMPQISIAPILTRVANVYAQMSASAGMPAGLDEMTSTTEAMLQAMGESTNLLGGLVSSSLLHVPTISAALLPPMTRDAVEIANSGIALLVWAGLALAGLLLGVFYMELLARVLPLGAAGKQGDAGSLARATLRHFGRVLLYVLLMCVFAVVAMVSFSMIVGVLLLVAPAAGAFSMAMAGGLVFVVAVYLYFVTAAIVLDDAGVFEAVGRSLQLVRKNFFPVVGFVVMITIIGLGIGLLLAQMAATSPFLAVFAIVLNAWIGTGLTMALLVFYRSRVLMAQQMEPATDVSLR